MINGLNDGDEEEGNWQLHGLCWRLRRQRQKLPIAEMLNMTKNKKESLFFPDSISKMTKSRDFLQVCKVGGMTIIQILMQVQCTLLFAEVT